MKQIKKEQLEFLNWEMGVFFHFGIRTFYPGHKDWDMQEMPAEGFNPTSLDCEDWIRTAKDGGATYAILVCKHHDGFANWPSKYTDYSVKNTPWKNGEGDVVREFVDACRKYDIKVGLYYSPAQFGSNKVKDYDDYFINQISELLTNYGKIDYLWFDGCGSEDHQYDENRIVGEIRRMQPSILIFNMWDPDTRWIGNESGIAPMSNNLYVDSTDFSVLQDDQVKLSDKLFLPGECDCRIRLENWFYSDEDEETLKSVDELMGLYYYSVGRGSNLLLNISPDRRGLVPDADKKRFLEFGTEIKRRFSDPVFNNFQKSDNTYILDTEKLAINHIVMEEDITEGNKIQEFSIYVHPYSYGKRILLYRGMTVGHKCICNFPTILAKKIEIEVIGENAKINSIKAYNI